MEYLKLLGIAVIVIGFALKWDTTAVVVVSAITTAVLSGMSIPQLLDLIGHSFVENRMVSLFFLTLPMIGLVESHGLKEVAVNGIRKLKSLTPSRILNLYLAVREIGGAFGIALSGQVQFVRPLIYPMVGAAAGTLKAGHPDAAGATSAGGAAGESATEGDVESSSAAHGPETAAVTAGARQQGEQGHGDPMHALSKQDVEAIKARCAAVDNFGNFFAQNLFIASGGVLLIASTMKSLGHEVSPMQVVLHSIPMAVIAFVVVAVYNLVFNRRFRAARGGRK